MTPNISQMMQTLNGLGVVDSVLFLGESTYCGKITVIINNNKAVPVNVDFAVEPRRNLIKLMDDNRLDYSISWKYVLDAIRDAENSLRLSIQLITSQLGNTPLSKQKMPARYEHVPINELPAEFWAMDNNARLSYGADYVPSRLGPGLEYLARILVYSNVLIFRVCDNGTFFN